MQSFSIFFHPHHSQIVLLFAFITYIIIHQSVCLSSNIFHLLLIYILRTSQQDFTEYSAKLEITSSVIMKISHGNKIRLVT